ncbi:VOC family protein [Caenimonas terrae]|uniref:VOC family protein n=1 Tax=Caenimonas terrae TaxID=696074 RepID=A0ABW0N974_9BURK
MEHALNWFEIPVADMDRAIRFYETASGGKLRREAFGGPGQELAVFPVKDEAAVKGALLRAPQARPSDQGAIVYLNAAPAIDAWLERAQRAGGKVLLGKTALPDGMGFFAHVLDTEGNRVGIHSLA